MALMGSQADFSQAFNESALERAPSTDIAQLEQRLVELGALSDAVVQKARPENTRLARAQDWKVWTRFCAEAHIPPLTVSEDLMVAYVSWLASEGLNRRPLAPASIVRRISGATQGMKDRGAIIPVGLTKKARDVVNGYNRELVKNRKPTGRGKAKAISKFDLQRIVLSLPNDLAGIRDRAIVLLGFSLAARRSELADLQVSDITESAHGLDVHIRWSKTGKPRLPGVPFGKNEPTCPIRAWQAWLTASGISDGPAFRRIRGSHVHGPLSPKAVGEAITRAGKNVDLNLHYTGHSLRRGLATEAREAKHDIVSIARHGGWVENSRSLYGYIEQVDKWRDNPLNGIGL